MLTKVMAESLGYFKDPFIAPFSKQKRKLFPIINRGTWARVHSIRQVVMRFLKQYPQGANVVSLGAGFDSTFFWLKEQNVSQNLCWIEIDYPDVVKGKVSLIKTKPLLSEMLPAEGLQASEDRIDLPEYKLFAADVREIDYIREQLKEVDKERPTLVITECLLVYMNSKDSNTILNGFASLFPTIGFLNYEMITPEDKFGQQMVENIEMRGCSLLGLTDCPSTEA